MKRLGSIGIMVILFLSLFTGALYANTSTRQDVVNAIRNMSGSYELELYNSGGEDQSGDLSQPLVMTDTFLFKDDTQLYDYISITYDFQEGDFTFINRLKTAGAQEITIGGRQTMIRQYQHDGEENYVIPQAEWVYGSFRLTIGAYNLDLIDRDKNLRDIEQLANRIEDAMRGIEYSELEAEEEITTEEEPVKSYSFNLTLEKAPDSDTAYKGVTAGADSSLELVLDLGSSFSGSIVVKEPEHGKIDGIDTAKKISKSGQVKFEYKPLEYIKTDTSKVTDHVTVEVYVEGEKVKTLKEPIQVQNPPVVLVHGFTGDASTWAKLDAHLKPLGYDTVREAYYFKDESGQSIPAQSKGLSEHIKNKILEYEKNGIKTDKVDVVAHSMGGLISRHLISDRPDLYENNIRKLIMVGTPNHGCGSLDHLGGWGLSSYMDKHEEAADQLYSESPFILALNRNEKAGTHLDPKVQYGLIYGTGTMLGDGVVTDTSALLNGVHSVQFPGLTHSTAVNYWGPPLTEDAGVFKQIVDWLREDIPVGEFNYVDMKVYSVEGDVYMTNPNYVKDDMYWKKISVDETPRIDLLDDLRTEKGRLTILLKSGNTVFGTVEMDAHTELYFEYASPHVMRVSLDKGSAKFSTQSGSGKHFETVLKASKKIQIVRGYQTEYVVVAGAEPIVHCIEGELAAIHGAGIDKVSTANLKAGQTVQLVGEDGFKQISKPQNAWWEDEFYDNGPEVIFDLMALLQQYREYLIGAGVTLLILLLFRLVRGSSRKKK